MSTTREEAQRQMGYAAEEAQARIRRQGEQAMRGARQGAEQARVSVASGLHTAASRLRQQSEQMHQPALSRVAEPMERGARYLESHSLPEMGSDIRTSAREHPLWTAAAVFAAAFLAGRLLRR